MSRGRRIIENTFGILSSRWRILKNLICAKPENVDRIILACVCLHNFLMKVREQSGYCPPSFIDRETIDGNVLLGDWRGENTSNIFSALHCTRVHNSVKSAYEMREKLANYFISPAGQVPWQEDYVTRGRHI